MLKRYTGDEIHGFMFPDYRSDEPRWIDGKELNVAKHDSDLSTIRDLGQRILALEQAMSTISHCETCATCANIAYSLLHGVSGSAPIKGVDHGN